MLLLKFLLSFSWAVGEWSTCSKSCGIGRKYRAAKCVAQLPDGGLRPSDTKHCSKHKPVTLKICVEKSCFLNWKRGPWSKVCYAVFREETAQYLDNKVVVGAPY